MVASWGTIEVLGPPGVRCTEKVRVVWGVLVVLERRVEGAILRVVEGAREREVEDLEFLREVVGICWVKSRLGAVLGGNSWMKVSIDFRYYLLAAAPHFSSSQG